MGDDRLLFTICSFLVFIVMLQKSFLKYACLDSMASLVNIGCYVSVHMFMFLAFLG